jgi:predicted TPR repeat methyltransferase
MQMELRYKENDRARDIYERYVQCLPTIKAWVRYAKFEFNAGDVARARAVYERAVQLLDGETAIVRLSLLDSMYCCRWVPIKFTALGFQWTLLAYSGGGSCGILP